MLNYIIVKHLRFHEKGYAMKNSLMNNTNEKSISWWNLQ